MTELERLRAERDMWRQAAENFRSCCDTYQLAVEMMRESRDHFRAEAERR